MTVTIDHTAPLAPSAPVLEPASDTSKGFGHTTKNNNPSPSNAPVFDVTGVEPNASVILFRAPVVGGVVGTFVQVNVLTATAGGTVAIADINSGKGKIPDGTYVYQAQQVDLAGNAGPLTANSATITIDTTAPPPPPARPRHGERHRGQQQRRHHADHLSGFPIFDISGVEGQATVKLFRIRVRRAAARSWSGPWSRRRARRRSPSRSSIPPIDTRRDLHLHGAADRPGGQRRATRSARRPPVIYDTAQPPTPAAPTLDPGVADGGEQPADDERSQPDVRRQRHGLGLQGQLVADPAPRRESPSPRGRTTSPRGRRSQITDPGPVSDGTHTYQLPDRPGGQHRVRSAAASP